MPFDRELSIIAVRGRDGAMAFYPLVENVHRHGILARSTAPAGRHRDRDPEQAAEIHAACAWTALDYVGVLAIEFFEVGGRLVANEMAPRVHNSGHWTIEGAATSQFENHIAAVAGWPLGATDPLAPSAMLDLIGYFRRRRTNCWRSPGVRLHLYGKSPRPARKVGHVTDHRLPITGNCPSGSVAAVSCCRPTDAGRAEEWPLHRHGRRFRSKSGSWNGWLMKLLETVCVSLRSRQAAAAPVLPPAARTDSESESRISV